MDRSAISKMEEQFVKISEVDNFTNSPDFEVPIYNVWKQQSKTAGVNHFGNSEVRRLNAALRAALQKLSTGTQPIQETYPQPVDKSGKS